MKIAYVYDVIYPFVKGGIQKRVWEIAKRLAKNHEVHIYGMKYWGGENIALRDGVYLHGVCKPMELYVGSRRSIKEAFYFAAKIFKPIMKEDFEVIDCQHAPYFHCFTVRLCSLIRNSQFLITFHEVWGDYWLEYLGFKGLFGKIIEKSTARLPKAMIAVSEKTKEGLLSLGAPEECISIVPNGIDFQRIQHVKPSNEKFDVIYVGRLISHKNVDLLLSALSIVKKRIPNIRCAVIGNGPEMIKLKILCKKLNLLKNVKFFGFVKDDEKVYSLMKSSKIFVLPSIREGFGVVVLEANACGIPVITVEHELNSAADLIKNGKNGFVVKVSPNAIANKIIEMIWRLDLNEISKHAKNFAKQYDWGVITKKVEDVYREQLVLLKE